MLRCAFIVLALVLSANSFAATKTFTGKINQVLVDDTAVGGCMALFSKPLSGLSCQGNWVSFSCTGDFNSTEAGARKLQAAQVALLTNTNVKIIVNDAFKHNGYCFGQRVYNIK